MTGAARMFMLAWLAVFVCGSAAASQGSRQDRLLDALVAVLPADAAEVDMAPTLGTAFAFGGSQTLLTSAHVVAGRERLLLMTRSGRLVGASVVGRDVRTDLALIRPDQPLGLRPLTLARNSRVALGTKVWALGHPLGRRFSVSRGIVGGLDRFYDTRVPIGFIQHDAALNPGNSGGPLVTSDGRVLGINTATPRETMFDIGMGFATPAELVAEIAAELLARGRVERGALGVMVSSADPLASQLIGGSGRALLVDRLVDAGSPLREGDLLLALDGAPLRLPRDLAGTLLRKRPGSTVRVDLLRNGKPMTLAVQLQPAGEEAGLARASAPIEDDPVHLAHGLVLGDGPQGLVVSKVAPGSAGQAAGIFPGDRIAAINNVAPLSVEDGRRRLAGPALLLRLVRRDGSVAHLLLRLDRTGRPDAPGQESFSAGPF